MEPQKGLKIKKPGDQLRRTEAYVLRIQRLPDVQQLKQPGLVPVSGVPPATLERADGLPREGWGDALRVWLILHKFAVL